MVPPPEEFLGPSDPKLETDLKLPSGPGVQKVKDRVEKDWKKLKQRVEIPTF